MARKPEWLGPVQKEMTYGPHLLSLWRRFDCVWRVSSVSMTHAVVFRCWPVGPFASISTPINEFWSEFAEYQRETLRPRQLEMSLPNEKVEAPK